MNRFVEIKAEQRSPGWFTARLGRLTASRAKDAIASIKSGEAAAKRDLRIQLVCERLTDEIQEDAPFLVADIQRGQTLEPEALGAYEIVSGNLVQRVGFLAHTEMMAGGSPDGVIGDYVGLVETKAPRPATHVRYMREDAIPKEHEAQLVHLLWLTGAQWIDFVSYSPALPEDLRLFVKRLNAADVDLSAYEKKVVAFLAEVEAEYRSLLGWKGVAVAHA